MLLKCILIASLWAGPRDAAAYEFEVDGVMVVTPLSNFALRMKLPQFSCRMHVCYRNCQWRIAQVWESPTNRIVQTISTDGNYIYKVDHVETLQTSWKALPNSWTVEIHAPGFPRRILAPEAMVLFYAYASNCYFDSVTNRLLDPIKFQPSDLQNGDSVERAVFALNSDALGLPRQISFLSAEQDVTNASFSAFGFTNIGPNQIPLTAVVTRFAQGPHTRYEFRANKIRSDCSLVSLKPQFPSGALTYDYRFSRGKVDGPPIAYPLSLDHWPSEAEAKLQPGYRTTQLNWEVMKKRTQASQARPKRAQRLIVIGVLLVSTAFFTTMVLRRSRRSWSGTSATHHSA